MRIQHRIVKWRVKANINKIKQFFISSLIFFVTEFPVANAYILVQMINLL